MNLTILFSQQVSFVRDRDVNPMPNPQPGGRVLPFGTSLLTRPAWETMSAAKLPSAQLLRPLDHTSPLPPKRSHQGK